MNTDLDDFDVDMNRIIVRPLYFGLFTNILIPMALILVCYYLNNRGGIGNSIGDFANTLFYFIGALAVVQSVFVLWWRMKRFGQPMIRRRETFEQDLLTGVLTVSRPIFIVIAIISVYAVVYFFLTGRFRETVFLIFFSFIVFQVVRPRHGQLKGLIATQKKLVEQGQFLS